MQIRIGRTKKRRRRIRATVFSLVIIILAPVAFVWLVNQPWLLTHILRTVNFRSPTQIALERFIWNPILSEIQLKGLGIHHVPNGRDGWIKDVTLSYSPLGFLRGKLVIDNLVVNEVNIVLPPTPKDEEKEERRELNIGKLLLLHGLVIERAEINEFTVAFAKDATFRADRLEWSLKPRFTGDTTLALDGERVTIHKAGKLLLGMNDIALKTSTRLAKWNAQFPYINAMEGTVEANTIVLQDLDMDHLDAAMHYQDGLVSLGKLTVDIGGNQLIGAASANFRTQKFVVNIDIPKPIQLPYLGGPTKTFDTAGQLSGHIEAEGNGFLPKRSSGFGHVALTQRFTRSPEYPVQVTSNFKWKNGIISLGGTNVDIGSAGVSVDGVIDVARKNIKLDVAGARIPVEAFFQTFRNPHLQKIYGATDAKAAITGWGKGITAKITATTFDGGFKPIVAERAESDIEIAYNKMVFAWKLYQGARQTGTADLTVTLGPRTADGSRSKSIDLAAKATDHSLEPSFPGFKLTGTATGEVAIKGPVTNFTGTAKGRIVDGGWLGVPLDEATTDIDITRRTITFENATITPRSLKKLPFVAPLVMDLSDGRFRLHGDPLKGLHLDLTYAYDSKRAQIHEISYDSPAKAGERLVARGSVVSGGPISIDAQGDFDLSLIEPVHALIREARGPVDAQLKIGGTTTSPAFYGTLTFNKTFISPRPIRLVLENLSGTVRFDGHRMHFDGITGVVEDGRFSLGGWLEHRNFKLASANLAFTCKEMSFRTAANTFRMEFDGDLTLTGAFPHPLLAGKINIIDGRYTKDFGLLDQLGGKRRAAGGDEAEIQFDPRLELDIHNTGDLLVRNNVGDIDLKADVKLTGLRSNPHFEGAISAREGRINYLGLKFEITRGFVEMRGKRAKPYLEIEAERELRLYNLTMRLYGYTDNLAVDLEGTSPSGPLEKRDVISLLAFGITEQERREYAAARTGGQMGFSVAAQQVGQLLERPVTEATRLDIFRIEAAEEDTDYDEPGKVATRLRVGKQLTDRLSIDYSVDIDTKDAEQTVTSEYLITDNVLISGSRSSEGKYEGNVGLRFRLR